MARITWRLTSRGKTEHKNSLFYAVNPDILASAHGFPRKRVCGAATAGDTVHGEDDYFHVGDVLDDKYRVDSILGRGGMGVVLAVWHQKLQERRAIKLMLPKMAHDLQAVERFTREARAASRLKSAHAVKIHDVDSLSDGVPYIVMEFLEGQDLQNLLQTTGPLRVDEACRYILQACEALSEAHELGIVHRDLKPANLFVTKGIARRTLRESPRFWYRQSG